jgi:hypothetical protein
MACSYKYFQIYNTDSQKRSNNLLNLFFIIGNSKGKHRHPVTFDIAHDSTAPSTLSCV